MSQRKIAFAFGAMLLCAPSLGLAQNLDQQANGFGLKEPTTPEEIAAAEPNPQAPGFRVPLPPLHEMDPPMREEYEQAARRLKTSVPPAAPLMVTPEIKERFTGTLPALAKAGIPYDIKELVTIAVARHWDAQFVWWVHAPQAVIGGVPAEAVEAIRLGAHPKFANEGQEAAYRYVVELLRDHKVSDATYERLRGIIGSPSVVAMTVLMGYYSTVSMTHIAHNLPLRADQRPLPPLARALPTALR